MKFIEFFCSLFFFAISPLWALDTSVKYLVGNYNIRIKTTDDTGLKNWNDRKESVAKTVIYNNFDVIGFQEIYDVAQETDLRSLLSGYTLYTWGRNSATVVSGERVGIAYKTDRFTVLDKGKFFISVNTSRPILSWDSSKVRLTVWMKLQDNETGNIFFFFATHLDNRGWKARREGARINLEKIGEIAGDAPAFLVGDFNSGDNNSEIYNKMCGYMVDSYKASESTPMGTYCTYTGFTNPASVSATGGARIDFVFVQNAKVLAYQTIKDDFGRGMTPSDHLCLQIKTSFEESARRHYIYVDLNRSESGDGSIENPYTKLEEALTMCENRDTIFVTQGVTSPVSSVPTFQQTAKYNINKSIVLLGGYDASFSNVVGRTTVSGDYLKNDQYDENGKVKSGNTDNLYGLFSIDFPYTVSFRNFNFEDVNAIGRSTSGGAISNQGLGLYLSNCDVKNCFVDVSGAGIFSKGELRADSCCFINNSSLSQGGAIFQHSAWPVTFTDCVFEANQAVSGSAAYLSDFDNCYIRSCTFVDNQCSEYGNLCISSGSNQVSSVVINNTFTNNRLDNQASSIPAGIGGSAVYANNGDTHVLSLVNNTIVGNTSSFATNTLPSDIGASVYISAGTWNALNNMITGNYTGDKSYNDLYCGDSSKKNLERFNLFSTLTSCNFSYYESDIYASDYQNSILSLSKCLDGAIDNNVFKANLSMNGGFTPTIKVLSNIYADKSICVVPASCLNEAAMKIDMNNNGQNIGYFAFDQRGFEKNLEEDTSIVGAYEYTIPSTIYPVVSDNPFVIMRDQMIQVCGQSAFAYQIVSIDGKVCQSGRLISGEIDVHNLPFGIYVLCISTSNGHINYKFRK